MTKMGSVHFTKEQVEYLMKKLGIEDPDEAIEAFAISIRMESVDPMKMPIYVKKLMEKDGVR